MTRLNQDKFSEAAFWDKVAKQRVYAAFDDEEYNELFDRTLGHDLEGMIIADIGSASGVSAAILAARGAKVIGIEISPELVEQANSLWSEYSDRLDFRVGDAEHLDMEDESVDAVFFGGVLHHIPLLDDVCKESLRILKPGGVFIAIEPNQLDIMERIEWAVADLRGKLSPNEYPINPWIMRKDLMRVGFDKVDFWTTRDDIPFLAQFPILKWFFSREKGFSIKKPILRFINAFRPPSHCGTFITLFAKKHTRSAD